MPDSSQMGRDSERKFQWQKARSNFTKFVLVEEGERKIWENSDDSHNNLKRANQLSS